METYFPWLSDNLEPPEIEVDPLASNYNDMVASIILQTPDPRLLPDYE